MDMELYVDTCEGPPTYQEGGYPPNPPASIWWRVLSKTHILEDHFMFIFSYLVQCSQCVCLQSFYTVQGSFFTKMQDMPKDISLNAEHKISHI